MILTASGFENYPSSRSECIQWTVCLQSLGIEFFTMTRYLDLKHDFLTINISSSLKVSTEMSKIDTSVYLLYSFRFIYICGGIKQIEVHNKWMRIELSRVEFANNEHLFRIQMEELYKMPQWIEERSCSVFFPQTLERKEIYRVIKEMIPFIFWIRIPFTSYVVRNNLLQD